MNFLRRCENLFAEDGLSDITEQVGRLTVKPIEIIPLARRKMGGRGIPEEWVIDVPQNPDQIVPGYAGRRVAQKRIEVAGRLALLRVIHEEFPDRIVVVTAYLTSAIDRYWRGQP